MATNKNQHFVPKCHLKPFTLNGDGASISLINIDRRRLIKGAPVKNQCSGDYFYGTDAQLESAIQYVESGYANALQELQSTKKLSPKNVSVFRIFWLFQYMRTEAAARRAVEMAESTRIAAELPQNYALKIKEAVQIGCKTFVSHIGVIDDLKCCLFKNRTATPFITSDNPAILTNRWQLAKDRFGSYSFGIGSAGSVMLLPLTPLLMIVFYDGDVYNIPNVRNSVDIRKSRDVIALNQHQFLSCLANVYLSDPDQAPSFLENLGSALPARPKQRHVIHYAEFDTVVGSHKRFKVVDPGARGSAKETLVHYQEIHPKPTIWPNQMQIRSQAHAYYNGSGAGYIRRAAAESDPGSGFIRTRI